MTVNHIRTTFVRAQRPDAVINLYIPVVQQPSQQKPNQKKVMSCMYSMCKTPLAGKTA